jgi:hypothetical protein
MRLEVDLVELNGNTITVYQSMFITVDLVHCFFGGNLAAAARPMIGLSAPLVASPEWPSAASLPGTPT